MKVTRADYELLRERVRDIPAGANERERWDALWRAVDNGSLDYGVLRPYQDAHIDTALRRLAWEKGCPNGWCN